MRQGPTRDARASLARGGGGRWPWRPFSFFRCTRRASPVATPDEHAINRAPRALRGEAVETTNPTVLHRILKSDRLACWSRTSREITQVSMASASLRRLRRLIPGTSGRTTTALRQAARCCYKSARGSRGRPPFLHLSGRRRRWRACRRAARPSRRSTAFEPARAS